MVQALNYKIVVSEFELQSRYYIHFRLYTLGKGMNSFILLAMGSIVTLPFFSKDGFGIKLLTMVDMPLNKKKITQQKQQTKPYPFRAGVWVHCLTMIP